MARIRLGDLFRRRRVASDDLAPIAPAVGFDDLRASVTSTTMTLQILHDRMSAQGWGNLPAMKLPLAAGPVEPLPERPADLGEGLWR